MARYLHVPAGTGGTTDHSEEIGALRTMARLTTHEHFKRSYQLAADLLEAHDDTGISLDDWPAAKLFVESLTGEPVLPNLI